jgi:Raf kinase inhibitor-like YbhB/YbcL family protein
LVGCCGNRRSEFAAAAVALAAGFVGTKTNAADIFTLSSTTFQDGTMMPKKVANSQANMATNANCVGDNVSPELHWTHVPDGTKSLVLLMFDPEGRAPSGVSHWVAYGISPSLTGFAEGETSKYSDKYEGGKSLMGVGHYSGPCTPPNTSPHCSDRYRLRSEGHAARLDARRGDRKVRAAADAREGCVGSSWAIRQSVAQLMRQRRTQSDQLGGQK